MARRSKQTLDPGTVLLIAAIAALAMVATFVMSLFAVMWLFSPCYWFFLLVGTLCYLANRTAKPPSNIAATNLFSTDELKSLIGAESEQRRLFEQKVKLYAEGHRRNIWTRRAEPTRFDERKSQARGLNDQLDRFDLQYEKLSLRMNEIRAPVLDRLRAWKVDVKVWNRRAALLGGTRWAILCYAVTALIVAAWQPASPEQFSSTVGGTVFINSITFASLYVSLMYAFPVSLVVGGIGFFVSRSRLDSRFIGDGAFYERWADSRTPPLHEYVDFMGSDEPKSHDYSYGPDETDDTEDTDDVRSDGEPQDERSCYEILGVTAQATIIEIKRAYGERIKQYHPDHVARMGPKVIEAAERETKLINAARVEALARCAREM